MSWLPDIVETRARHPEAIAAAAARRVPADLADDHLLIVAADHPARAALGSGELAMAMADRVDLIDRLRLALANPRVHGVLAGPDVLEDLLLLGALDRKLVLGSMNRAGIAGAAFEIDDRFTGCAPETLRQMGFDGGKMLLRIDPSDPATPRALESCAGAVSALADRRLMAMVEPFWCYREGGCTRNDLSPKAMIKAISVASALGTTSAYTWLKVPVVEEMERVMAASTLPALVLGGETGSDRERLLSGWKRALALPTVRGLILGRNLLYPPDGDTAGAVDTAVELVAP
ncbi:MAG: Cgl0159 family (beta/alpha)8-fold protein [Mycobacteriales bacterium]